MSQAGAAWVARRTEKRAATEMNFMLTVVGE